MSKLPIVMPDLGSLNVKKAIKKDMIIGSIYTGSTGHIGISDKANVMLKNTSTKVMTRIILS